MPYGELTPEMEHVLRPVVAGRVVWDLGAGDGVYATRLLKLGASKVIAIEKEWDRPPRLPKAVEWRREYFEQTEVPGAEDVVFLSWPPNQPLWGLVRLLEGSVVAYLGCNCNGSACGPQSLWEHLTSRTVLAHVPLRRNSLIVYGETSGRRPLLGEEVGATCGVLVDFEAAQETATMVQKVFDES